MSFMACGIDALIGFMLNIWLLKCYKIISWVWLKDTLPQIPNNSKLCEMFLWSFCFDLRCEIVKRSFYEVFVLTYIVR